MSPTFLADNTSTSNNNYTSSTTHTLLHNFKVAVYNGTASTDYTLSQTEIWFEWPIKVLGNELTAWTGTSSGMIAGFWWM